MNNFFLVFIGGGLGSVVRFAIAEFTRRNFQFVFPAATLCSNVLSCIVLGIVYSAVSDKTTGAVPVKLLLITGFCGGFSTFSAFSFETIYLLKSGYTTLAIANVFLSLALCFAVIFFLSKNT